MEKHKCTCAQNVKVDQKQKMFNKGNLGSRYWATNLSRIYFANKVVYGGQCLSFTKDVKQTTDDDPVC